MIFDFSGINLADKLIGLLLAVVQALLIALITKNALDRTLQKERQIGKRLQDYGVESVKGGDGKMSKAHANVAFGQRGHRKPAQIDLCFISGRGFFRDYKEELVDAAKNGCTIRVLLANPYSGVIYEKWKIDINSGEMRDKEAYFNDVAACYYEMLASPSKLRNASFIERSDLLLLYHNIKHVMTDKAVCTEKIKEILKKSGDHRWQVIEVKKEMEEAFKENGCEKGSIEFRYYTDEYRLPITLIKKDKRGRQPATTFLWTNMNSPTRETSESINIFCRVQETEESKFVSDIELAFNYLWDCYKPKGEAEFKSENRIVAVENCN